MKGIPRKDYGCPLRIWRSGERYTILPPRSERAAKRWLHVRITGGLPMWDALYWPRPAPDAGYETAGPHLGERVTWSELPEPVQQFVRASDFGEYAPPVQP